MLRGILLCLLVVGCTEDTVHQDNDTQALDTQTMDTQSDTGGTMSPADLCTSDEDCTDGTCTAVASAARVCVFAPPRELSPCDTPEEPPGCCADSDCTDGGRQGACVDSLVDYCGGAGPQYTNLCRYDACAEDSECGTGQACLPAGAFGHPAAQCIEAACAAHSDCTARSGGLCSLLANGTTCADEILGCTYDDSECRSGRDCPRGFFCVANSERDNATCQEEQPAP